MESLPLPAESRTVSGGPLGQVVPPSFSQGGGVWPGEGQSGEGTHIPELQRDLAKFKLEAAAQHGWVYRGRAL